MSEKNSAVKDVSSSIDLLWDQSFQEIDLWVERSKKREEVLLQSAKDFAENIKRNKQNLKQLTEQFTNELRELERKSRDEVLTTTTSFQYIFPMKSYEEINKQLDAIQNKSSEFTLNPIQNYVNNEFANKLVVSLEKYIEFIQENRNQYVKSMKETASIIQENQRAFLAITKNQMKNVFFPLNKYMDDITNRSQS